MDHHNPPWDLDRVRALAVGSDLTCVGEPEDVAAVMAALGHPVDPEAAEPTIGARLQTFLREDRDLVAGAWREALAQPGQIMTCRARTLVDGAVASTLLQIVNLLATDLRVMLVASSSAVHLYSDAPPVAHADRPVTGDPASWALIHVTIVGTVRQAAGTCRSLFGREASDLVGGSVTDVVHPDDLVACLSLAATATTAPGVARSLEHRVVRAGGGEVWVQSTVTYDPATDQLQLLIVDITQRRAQEAALQESREEILGRAEEFRLLAEEIPSGAFRADATGRILFANSRFRALAGTGEVIALADLAAPSEVDLIRAALADASERALDADTPSGVDVEPTLIEFRSRADDRTLSLRLGALRGPGAQRTTLVGVLLDVTPTVELRAQARTDPLTELLNRTALNQHLEALLDENRPLCVMFIDFDEFKRVNDRYGHHAGDEVLRVIGRRLRNAVRGSEEVGRYGGDEFVVACATSDRETIANLQDRVEAVLAEPVHFDDSLWHPAASIGVACSEPGDTAESVLRRADAQMYQEKRRRAI